MSIRAMMKVFEHSEAKANDRLVLLAIADVADDEGRNAELQVAVIARKVRASERAVQYSLAALEELGELRVMRRYKMASLYEVSVAAPPLVAESDMVDEIAEAIKEYSAIIPPDKQKKITYHQEMRIREYCMGYGPGIVRNAIASLGDGRNGKDFGYWSPDKVRQKCEEFLAVAHRAVSVTSRLGSGSLADILNA